MNFKIIEQREIAIVTISGNIGREDKESLASCTQELTKSPAKSVVIYFKNVTQIENLILRELTLLQHEMRQNNKRLRLVGLSLQLRSLLIEKGVIRSNELGTNLNEVIFSLNKLA